MAGCLLCDCVRGCLDCVLTQRSGQGASHQRNPLPTRQSNETTTIKTTAAKQHMSHGRPMGRERIGKIDQDAPRCPRKARHRQPPQLRKRTSVVPAGELSLDSPASQPAGRPAASPPPPRRRRLGRAGLAMRARFSIGRTTSWHAAAAPAVRCVRGREMETSVWPQRFVVGGDAC
jgi:hypothetical protein